MQRVPFYQIDSFADKVLRGNPAAVLLLPAFPPDDVMQAIAQENNLSETAFVVEKPRRDDGEGEVGGDKANTAEFALRWFTPAAEVALCGHATFAAGLALFLRDPTRTQARFSTRSGVLVVDLQPNVDTLAGALSGGKRRMRLAGPALATLPHVPSSELLRAMGLPGAHKPAKEIVATFAAADESAGDVVIVLENADAVRGTAPDFAALAALSPDGVIVTAPADACAAKEGCAKDGIDFVSRYFAPRCGIDEDPVTGYAHFLIANYWGTRLQRDIVTGRQVSARPGNVECHLIRNDAGDVDSIALIAHAIVFAEGVAYIDDIPPAAAHVDKR